MKRTLFFTVLLVCATLSSCQCADQPDVGPVEGEDESAQVLRGDVHEAPTVA